MSKQVPLAEASVRCESRTRFEPRRIVRCALRKHHGRVHTSPNNRHWTDAEAVTEFGKRLPRHDGLCRACGQEPRSPTTNNGLGKDCLREHRKRYTKAARDPDHLVYRRWTREDEEKLREVWGKVPPREAARALGRTYEALRVRAHLLGLKTGRHGAYPHLHDNEFGCTCAAASTREHWSANQVAILEIRYSRGDRVEDIAAALRRSKWAVREKVRSLKISRMKLDDGEEAA